jgi:RNA polymerase sigma-70 factor (ECF subfamily)
MTTLTFKRSAVRVAGGGRMTAPAKAPARFVATPGLTPQGRETAAETSFDLLLRARLGDPDAQNELYRRYLPRLNRWARGQLPHGARSVLDTGDVVQEVLIKVIKALPEFEPRHEGGFQGFLRLILTHKLCDVARRVKRRPPGEALDDAIPDGGLSPLERAIGCENRERYQAACRRLSPDDRQVIFARLELGFSYEEAAQALGKPTPNAARVATRRAMIRLAKEMSRAPHEP